MTTAQPFRCPSKALRGVSEPTDAFALVVLLVGRLGCSSRLALCLLALLLLLLLALALLLRLDRRYGMVLAKRLALLVGGRRGPGQGGLDCRHIHVMRFYSMSIETVGRIHHYRPRGCFGRTDIGSSSSGSSSSRRSSSSRGSLFVGPYFPLHGLECGLLVEQDVGTGNAGACTFAKEVAHIGLVDRLDQLVVKEQPSLVLGLDDGHVVAVEGATADVHHHSVQLVQAVGLLGVVGGVEEAEVVRVQHAVVQLLEPVGGFHVLEALEVQGEHARQPLDLHAFFGFLQASAVVAVELVSLAQHFRGREVAQARGDGRVPLKVDRQVHKLLVAARDVFAREAFGFRREQTLKEVVDPARHARRCRRCRRCRRYRRCRRCRRYAGHRRRFHRRRRPGSL